MNPIKSVDGKPIFCPSGYIYKLEDISASDAGRTEDTTMHKKRLGQIVGIELSWRNIPTETVSALLKAFNPEYLLVEYLDGMEGRFLTDEFYVGNRTAPMYNAARDLWSGLSFNIIRRRG